MFLGMMNWMRAETIETTIRRLAHYGFECLEIAGEPEQYDTKEVRRLLNENGVKCWGAATLMTPGRDLIHADPKVRESTIKFVKNLLTLAKELDGRILTIVPSQVGKVTPMASPEEEWRWAVESLKEIYTYSEAAGITLALEPLNRFETNFINRADQALCMAQAVGPNCGIALDAFHINIEEADLYKSVTLAGKKLVDFHVADNNRWAAGQGDYNWPKLIKALNAGGYKYSLTVEFVAPVDRTPRDPYPGSQATSNANLTPEQLKFILDHGSGLLTEEFYSGLVAQSARTIRKAMKSAAVAETRMPKKAKVSRKNVL